MEEILRREGYMYTQIIEKDLTAGQALDKCIKENKKVTRQIWKGYWVLADVTTFTKPIITAILKNNEGVVVATPYQEDLLATDWMVVE